MSNDTTTLSKREALESLLSQGDVLIQLDPRADGVVVPPDLSGQPLLVLRIGLDMPVPIPDLDITDQRVQATLSFNREPYHVNVPWHAVFGMVSEAGQGLLWTGDVPVEVMEQMLQMSRHDGEPGDGDASEAPDAEAARGPRLVAIDGGRSREADEEPPPRPDGPPTLKLVR